MLVTQILVLYEKLLMTYLQTLVKLLLLLVYDTETEVDLIGLFEIRSHAHNLGEGLLSMIKGSVAVIEYTDSVPKFRLLSGIMSYVQCCKLKEQEVNLP